MNEFDDVYNRSDIYIFLSYNMAYIGLIVYAYSHTPNMTYTVRLIVYSVFLLMLFVCGNFFVEANEK